MRRRAFLAASAAALPVAAGAQILPGGQLRQSTIAVSVPLSGPLANYGNEVVRGVQAAIEEANRLTAPLQRAYGIRSFDDQNSGSIATTNVSIAAADPSAVAMIGNLTAEVTLRALPQYANANFALIVPTITADVITARGFRNIFRLPTKDSSEGVLVARALLQGKKSSAVLAITVDGEYGTDVARGFVNQAKSDKHDATLVTLPNGFDPGAMAETLIKESPQLIFLCGKAERLGSFADSLRTAGYRGDFCASDSFYTQSTIEKFGKILQGALVASSFPPLNRIPSIFQT
ncbi:MAG TPA: ABC transporter substrate-binding protein, partial [Candidatus Baltobacteraceae bacterium]|nr:ABC transporter substrate-binding protein [Candidatus Baltobacteraceae bacterium]